jgi:uncharacterized metal-binding protein
MLFLQEHELFGQPHCCNANEWSGSVKSVKKGFHNMCWKTGPIVAIRLKKRILVQLMLMVGMACHYTLTFTRLKSNGIITIVAEQSILKVCFMEACQ